MAKAFVVAAPSSGSGKTMLTLGLLRAFRNRGLRVASAKVGPDHIDPRFHEAASGRPCLNLDPWAMKREVIASLLTDLNHDADLVIVEGVMGLFDGPQGATGSTADLAQDMGLPIVLVLDSGHQGQSIAALAEGFLNHRKGLTFAGLILNRVASDKHAAILTAALAPLGVPILGLVRRSDSLNWPSRHLGLVQAQENQELELFIETTSLAVARETKLDKLLTLGAEIRPESLSGADPATSRPENSRRRRRGLQLRLSPHPAGLEKGGRGNLPLLSPERRSAEGRVPMPFSCPAAIPSFMPACWPRTRRF